MDPRGSGLEQNVGESAGGGADIEQIRRATSMAKWASAPASLRPPPADVGRAREDLDAAVVGDGLAGLGGFFGR